VPYREARTLFPKKSKQQVKSFQPVLRQCYDNRSLVTASTQLVFWMTTYMGHFSEHISLRLYLAGSENAFPESTV
jgi:hypothetical protein